MGAKLGRKYRDTVNGFEGVAISTTQFLHACERVTLSALSDGDIKEFTFDFPQLEEVKAPRVPVTPASRRMGGGLASQKHNSR